MVLYSQLSLSYSLGYSKNEAVRMKSGRIYADYALLQKTGAESLEEKINSLSKEGVQNLKITGLFVSRGFEFNALKKKCLNLKNQFKKLILTEPFLSSKAEIRRFAACLIQNSYFNLSEKTLLVAHGRANSENHEYFLLERTLHKLGAKNVRIVVLKGKRSGRDFVSNLVKSGEKSKWQEVALVPLFIKTGNHVKNDIFGSSHEESLCEILEENGFSVAKKCTALSEHDWFWEYVNEK